MKGDFTRSTFDPSKGYSSVRMQQGRVQLDADWNEQVDIGDRLRQEGFTDIIGATGAPVEGGGFQVCVDDPDTKLAVTRGRIWADGILCETPKPDSPTDTWLFLDKQRGGFDYPNEAGTYLIYLDVWQQHITALEDPSLREDALGGADTTTRTRTVAQVKQLKVNAGTQCADVIKQLVSLKATGTLQARIRPAPEAGSCVIPKFAGYTGLENQLYRVEVHTEGEIGKDTVNVTFKWSRENASIVTQVTEIDNVNNVITVKSLGHDSLGFHDAKLVEITDENQDLNGKPGLLCNVTAVGDNTLSLSSLNDAPMPTVSATSKVRRWDGFIKGPFVVAGESPSVDEARWIELEAGIQIAVSTGKYNSGDWWWIPARTGIGELGGRIEWLLDGIGNPKALPPHGIEHHYCALAVAIKKQDGRWESPPQDCRSLFKPLTNLYRNTGCCTVVVEPGDESGTIIQNAIDSMNQEIGGRICLRAGTHKIISTICISRKEKIVICGEGLGATIQSDLATLLKIENDSSNIRVEGLSFNSTYHFSDNEGTRERPFCIEVSGVSCTVCNNDLTWCRPYHGGIRVTGKNCKISGNRLTGPNKHAGFVYSLGISAGHELHPYDDQGEGAEIYDNHLEGIIDGIGIFGADNVVIRSNRIHGNSEPINFMRIAIGLILSEHALVTGNIVEGAQWGGLTVEGNGCCFENNQIRRGWGGIFASLESSLLVTGNRIEDMMGPGMMGFLLMEQVTIRANRFVSCGYAPGIPKLATISVWIDCVLAILGGVTIEDCEIIDTGIRPLDLVAIQDLLTKLPTSKYTEVLGVIMKETPALLRQPAWGILCWGSNSIVRGNRISYSDQLLWLYGAAVLVWQRWKQICPNPPVTVNSAFNGAHAALVLVGFYGLSKRASTDTSSTVKPGISDFGYVPPNVDPQNLNTKSSTAQSAYGRFAHVEGNYFMGLASKSLVNILYKPEDATNTNSFQGFERLVFSTNFCQRYAVVPTGSAVVELGAHRSIVQGNHVDDLTTAELPLSFKFTDTVNPTLFMGNAVSGRVGGKTKPEEFETFNQIG